MIDVVIDVSHYNGHINFSKLKNYGIQAVIIKATEGLAWTDTMFASNISMAKTNGILFGAYHFGTGDDATKQANHFLSIARDVPLKVLDFELSPSGESMTPVQAEEFVNVVESNDNKCPIIYADYSHIEKLSALSSLQSRCKLWIAEYKYEALPQLPTNSWSNWCMWQYTDKGIVDGVIGKVDRSYFNGEYEDLKELFS